MYRALIQKYLLIVLITFFAGLLRFYKLSQFPVHLGHDEVTQLYDAISIAQTGKDVYGNYMPLIFESVNDFKPPFYTYATVISYFIFGNKELTIRIVAAFFGTLIIPATYFFVRKLFKSSKIAIICSLLAAIAPYEMFYSRKSFESGTGVFFMLTGFTFLLSFLDKPKKRNGLYIGIVLLAFSMYVHFSQAIIVPLLFISFWLIYKKKFKLSNSALFIGLFALLPFISIILLSPDARSRSKDVYITQDIKLGQQIDYSKTENKFTSLIGRYKTIADYSFNRYLSHLNPIFLFSNGLDLTNRGPMGIGPLYFVQLPFFIFGIYYLVRKEKLIEGKRFVLAWVILGLLLSGLTFEELSPHRSIIVFTMLNVISGIGIYWFYEKVRKFDSYFIRAAIYSFTTLVFALNFIHFYHVYAVNFPYEKSQKIHYPYEQLARFAWSEYENYENIVFDPFFGHPEPFIGTAAHYYFAYYGDYPPEEFQKQYRLGDQEKREVIFDKFSIRKVDWRVDRHLQKTLVIASKWSLPIDEIEKEKIIKIFYFYNNRDIAYYAVSL
jgi:4-amino-4-deoxy-L-arabinose transferase-like glycosyltransferase